MGTVGGICTMTYDALYGIDLVDVHLHHQAAAGLGGRWQSVATWLQNGSAPGLSVPAAAQLTGALAAAAGYGLAV
eukprot:5692039-Alexandrium_andersonii.AAC.1